MKKILYFMLAALMVSACERDRDDLPEAEEPEQQEQGGFKINPEYDDSVTIQFVMAGDAYNVQTTPFPSFTRALTADGKDMTDVWVLDYVSDELQHQIHQSDNTAADFGLPTLNLSFGTHHIYFVASRSTGATLNTDAKTLAFTKVLDTFWRDYTVTITEGTSSGSRTVALDRIVTRLKLTFTDAIPANASTFNVTLGTWYYGFNYTTGTPTTASSNSTVVVNIPTSSIGQSGQFVNVYGFSPTAEWTTNVAVNCKDGSNNILGSATIADVPFRQNRISAFSGPLFTSGGAMTLSLNTDWLDDYTGTW